ncbi:hypothetical protein CRE_07250 [Caenorhabditis remanei]|uniref:Uncharacterized protein n=1 Tax=Caenorhabditis remanei TaxID=31234 RepID=E3M2C0_CAERE|nr:hypothetical protein CRE_07250 [Caenorhabditis remanei]
MPVDLEHRIKNLDQVFHEQWSIFNKSNVIIKKSLENNIIGNWQHIDGILTVCERRIKTICGDYMRATSYEAMRIINTRMTDVLNVILPIKAFMEYAIKRCKELEEEELIAAAEKLNFPDSNDLGAVEPVELDIEKKPIPVELAPDTKIESLEEDSPGVSQLMIDEKPAEVDNLAAIGIDFPEKNDSDVSKLDVQKELEIEDEEILPEENDLLLNENHNKPNGYEEKAKKKNGLLSCFGL